MGNRQYFNDSHGHPIGFFENDINGYLRGYTKEGHPIGYVHNDYTYEVDGTPFGPGNQLMALLYANR